MTVLVTIIKVLLAIGLILFILFNIGYFLT